MPRVQWDTQGTRFFETGIDRGMLYVPPAPGVPWNGLIRVSEEPTGGKASEYYIDGEKFLNVASLEEYAATIEAFSSPVEFAPCAGLLKLSSGLYASDQFRQPFGFSYRTLVGDDIQGISAGYKLHVVYNALAKSADFSHRSMSDRPEVEPYSWAITAIPETVEGFRPSAHFVLDSRKIDSASLADIENVLYGTVTDDPRLLSVLELMIAMQRAYISGGVILEKMQIRAGTDTSLASGDVRLEKMRIAGEGVVGSGYSWTYLQTESGEYLTTEDGDYLL